MITRVIDFSTPKCDTHLKASTRLSYILHRRAPSCAKWSVMERVVLLEHLSAAKRHADQGEVHIAAQKRIIAELFNMGSDTADAERLLALFEETQQNHLNHVERILDLLAKIPLVGRDGSLNG